MYCSSRIIFARESCINEKKKRFLKSLPCRILSIQFHCISSNIILVPRLYFFSCSIQVDIKFIRLINVIMPTVVGILTFINMINTISESLKAMILEFISS